ncbi:MAG: galactose-1-phosphate uridylyltransferase [Congregibacter sp.]
MTIAKPHRRYDPLRDRWVLVSPQRDQRPWQGQLEDEAPKEPSYAADCYLCPANERAGGIRNPDYEGVFVFDNDFPALLSESWAPTSPDPLMRAEAVRGRCRVICYSPTHNLTLASMPPSQVREVVDTWAQESEHLSETYEHVQIFENRGATMGCSNAHPHGQIWALDAQPSEVIVEAKQQRDYFEANGQAMLLDYARRECGQGERVVVANRHWVAVVPWWATWPFETLLLPMDSVQILQDLGVEQRNALAEILSRLLRTYDRLFNVSFPYSMGWHGAPRSDRGQHWQLHAHFYPPLLRSATVRKHMVGFEMLGESQRDLTSEKAAATLRKLATAHTRA